MVGKRTELNGILDFQITVSGQSLGIVHVLMRLSSRVCRLRPRTEHMKKEKKQVRAPRVTRAEPSAVAMEPTWTVVGRADAISRPSGRTPAV